MVDGDGGVRVRVDVHGLRYQSIGHEVLDDLDDGTVEGWDGGGVEKGCLGFGGQVEGGGAEK